MEPLVFKIETQADDSGVRKYEKSIGGLDVSSRKASGALKSFAQDIAQARDGADIASAALGAFSRILGSSLAATGVIVAVKTVIDGFSKIDQAVKESEKAVADAFAGMEKAGKALSFAEAVSQAKTFENTAYKIREEIKKINESPMLNIIDGLMQSTDRMRELAKQSEDQGIAIRKSGAESELAYLIRIKGLNAEGKALAANELALQKELEGIDAIKEASTALAVTQKYAMQADEIRAKFADERGKAEADLSKQKQKDLDEQIKKERELEETQQKRFNELYNAEIKSQEQTQKRIDAEIKAEEERAAKRASLEADVAIAKEEEQKAIGEAVPSILKYASGGSGARGRETSSERGAREAGERAYITGRREASDAEIQRTINVIKEEKKAVGDTTSTGINEARNRLIDIFKSEQKSRGSASIGIDRATKSVTKSTTALSDFNKSASEASSKTETFSTNLSDLGTGFDDAMKSADMFSSGLIENSGNMISDFLKTGDSSSELADDFDDASKSVEDFNKRIKTSGGGAVGGGSARGKSGEKGLGAIWELLNKNLTEMRTYALVK